MKLKWIFLLVLLSIMLTLNFLYFKNWDGNLIIKKWSMANCIVTKVIDWDWVDLRCNDNGSNNIISVKNNRLLGIDAFELWNSLWIWKKDECFAKEAKEKLDKITLNKNLDVLFLWSDDCVKWICRNEIILYYSKDSKIIDLNDELIKWGYTYVWDKYVLRKTDQWQLENYLLSQEYAKNKKLWMWWKCLVEKNNKKDWRLYLVNYKN